MYQSNYFQKGMPILSLVMLLTIPNLYVYSVIGSYQTDSQTISVNVNYLERMDRQGINNLHCLSSGTVDNLLYESEEVILGVIIDKKALQELTDYINNNSTSGQALSLKTKPYAKYDFSGFDN